MGGAFLYDLSSPDNRYEEMKQIPDPEHDYEKNKYTGYSSVICNMDGDDGNGQEMIFGAPRGSTYKGEVCESYYIFPQLSVIKLMMLQE